MVREEEGGASAGAMGKKSNEFLKYLCYLYMIALLVVLPLHTGGVYWSLGERKYELFRRVSLLCLGCWVVAALLEHIWNAVRGRNRAARGSEAGRGGRGSFSSVDWAVACYGVCVLLSALFSGYGSLAWVGYEGWRMGAVSQLMFVGIYFFVSRRYEGSRIPLYLGEAAVCLVTLFGLLHRLGIDPLGLLVYWSQGDWEYSHMLSTLGNINWLCGYYSVALALLMVHYLGAGRRWSGALLYVAAVATFVLLGVQGSQGGLLILAVCVAVCALLGWEQAAALQKVWALLTGFFLGMPVMGLLMKLRGNKAAVVEDGDIFSQVGWQVWIIAAIVCAAMYLLHVRKGNVTGRLLGHRGVRAALICGMAAGITAVVVFVLFHGIDDEFGSGRGFLWRLSVEGLLQADGKSMLLGAGPDCYGEEIYGVLGAGTSFWQGTRWDGAVYTNAHNEVLTQLCNVGILGTASYLAIFLMGWLRYAPCGRRGGQASGAEAVAEEGRSRCIEADSGEGRSRCVEEGSGEGRSCCVEAGSGEGQSRCIEADSGEGRSRCVEAGSGEGQSRCVEADSGEGRSRCVEAGSGEGQSRCVEAVRGGRLGFGGPDIFGWMGPLAIAMYGIHGLISFQQVLNAPLLFLVLGVCEQRLRARADRESDES